MLELAVNTATRLAQILDLLAEDNRLISNDVGNVNVHAGGLEVRHQERPPLRLDSEGRDRFRAVWHRRHCGELCFRTR